MFRYMTISETALKNPDVMRYVNRVICNAEEYLQMNIPKKLPYTRILEYVNQLTLNIDDVDKELLKTYSSDDKDSPLRYYFAYKYFGMTGSNADCHLYLNLNPGYSSPKQVLIEILEENLDFLITSLIEESGHLIQGNLRNVEFAAMDLYFNSGNCYVKTIIEGGGRKEGFPEVAYDFDKITLLRKEMLHYLACVLCSDPDVKGYPYSISKQSIYYMQSGVTFTINLYLLTPEGQSAYEDKHFKNGKYEIKIRNYAGTAKGSTISMTCELSLEEFLDG